jgi:hypothetical protein
VAGEILAPDATLFAQSVTTAAVRGTVRLSDGNDPEGARVIVRHAATGFVLEVEVRRGRFLAQGLEPGGPYTITVRRIGALARRWDGVFLTLGEPLGLDIVLDPAPVQLDSVVVLSTESEPLSCCHGGTATTLSDSLIHHLPSLNRDVYDFVRLVPQISTRIGFEPGGMSGGGVGFRLNSFRTNGVSERSLGGGQPPEFAGGRSLPFDAVREYQVLVAPFDVRYGDFAGAMVNTLTRAGTNQFHGSAFGFGRNDALARGGELAADPYKRWQYGFSVSGPILRDRVQFLFASEFQQRDAPMVGPYVGQPADAKPPVPVSEADFFRLDTIMDGYGLEAGSGGAVSNRNWIRSLFARVDVALASLNSRAVLWVNDSDTEDQTFSRERVPDQYPLSSTASQTEFGARTVALQLHTALPRRGGGHNELSVSRRSIPFQGVPETRQPIVQVRFLDSVGVRTTVLTGSGVSPEGSSMKSWDVIVRDDLTMPLGADHVASVGVEAEWFRIAPSGLSNASGTWLFSNLDALEDGEALRFTLAQDRGGAAVPLSGAQFAAYAGDLWRIGDRVTLTLGLRADLLAIDGQAPYNRLVDSLFDRRTDQPVPRQVELSPRLGFIWDTRGAGQDQIRGGIGIFTGRPPLAWYHAPLRNYGTGIVSLRCGPLPTDLGPAPPFDPDPAAPPVACANEQRAEQGEVELVEAGLRTARTLRGVVAYERRLPGDFIGTAEAVVTRNLTDFSFANLNLAGPRGTDRMGRVLYGGFDDTGIARPVLIENSLPSVIEMRNVSENHGVQVAVSLARHFERGFTVRGSYTWSRVRDVGTPLRVNNPGSVNWGLRAVSGRHDDLTPGISLNDVPHRLVLAGTWRAPWQRWLTEVSLLYVGESGSPFTYVAGGDPGFGDLNADGGLNDPIYVPRNALDPEEMVVSRAEEFEQFIQGSSCLSRQRGRIMERNSCREPWANTTALAIRQLFPFGSQAFEAQVEVFNLLNLINGDWGRRRLANTGVLDHVGQTTRPSGVSEPAFQFVEGAADWIIDPAESAFQLQFGVRYRF